MPHDDEHDDRLEEEAGHDHGHQHGGHGHSHAPPDSNVAFAVGVALNLGFVVAEVVCGLAAHSLALLSERWPRLLL